MLTVTLDEPTTQQLEGLARSRSMDVAELAEEAIRSHLRAVRRAAMDREAAAFVRLHPQLLATIPGEYAAIFNGELVDHDEDQLAVLSRVQKAFSGMPVLIRQVTSIAEPTITIYSPRLEIDNG
ncbi:MAG: hypothetical protein KF753_14075 [Caldilineaceae bacterium]|nr:hypothetical protein [Caldilineaceae bacterium]